MQYQDNSWEKWNRFFSSRSDRQLPALEDVQFYGDVPESVAKSLAIFQLGESGGGSIIEQARQSTIAEIDQHYAKAIELFVAEEHRHAEILAICVRNLGGTLIRTNWTARLFVHARRLIGLRLKVVVLLAAEVVGLCYYHLLATRLPPGRLKSLLAQIVNDERSHLNFHCEFLRSQVKNSWRRAVFRIAWRSIMFAAAIVVLIDHHATLRDLNLPVASAWRRWMAYTKLAERLISNASGEGIGDMKILEELNAMDHLKTQGQSSRAPGSSGLTEANAHARADFSKYDVRTATSR